MQGHEPGRTRPVLVVSVDAFNSGPADLVTILPVTTNLRRITGRVALTPPEAGVTRPSMIITEHCRTITQTRLTRSVGRVTASTLASVERSLRLFLGL